MVHVAVVGGGPAGLSAALFTSKNGLDTTVFDTDKTWLHKAHLFNYLGIRSMDGDVFMQRAREQATADHGVDIRETKVTGIEASGEGFTVSTEEADHDADYLVLATGANRDLAEDLGCATADDDTIDVDLDMETSVEHAYATGAMVRAQKWQAVISAGDGAAAALDILSKEKGENFHDFDTPDDVPGL